MRERTAAAQRRFNEICRSHDKALQTELAYQRQLIKAGVDGSMLPWEYWEGLVTFAASYVKDQGWTS